MERTQRPIQLNQRTGIALRLSMHMPMSVVHDTRFKTIVIAQSRSRYGTKTVSFTTDGDQTVLSEGYRDVEVTLVWQIVKDPAPISGHYDTRHNPAAGRAPAALRLRRVTSATAECENDDFYVCQWLPQQHRCKSGHPLQCVEPGREVEVRSASFENFFSCPCPFPSPGGAVDEATAASLPHEFQNLLLPISLVIQRAK